MCSNNFDWILDDLALGNVRAHMNLDLLLHHGITVIVCALPTLPLPLKTYKERGFAVLHIPIDDSPQVNIGKWFDDVSDFIMAHRLMNRKTLVNCHAGISRSSTLVTAYIMNLFQCDESRALSFIRDKRSCVMPNHGFLRQLIQYGKKYK